MKKLDFLEEYHLLIGAYIHSCNQMELNFDNFLLKHFCKNDRDLIKDFVDNILTKEGVSLRTKGDIFKAIVKDRYNEAFTSFECDGMFSSNRGISTHIEFRNVLAHCAMAIPYYDENKEVYEIMSVSKKGAKDVKRNDENYIAKIPKKLILSKTARVKEMSDMIYDFVSDI